MRWWPLGRRQEQRQQMNLAQLLAESAPPTWAGVPVGTDQALRLAACWACVQLLASSISTLPVHAYREGEHEPITPKPALLRHPAAGMPLPDWLHAAMVSLLLRGNVFGIVVARDADLRPMQVELVHPDRMAVRVTDEGAVEYRLGGRVYDPADVWHVRGFTMPGSLVGLSPVEYARQGIGLGLAAEEYGARLFGTGSLMGGVLQTDAELDEDKAKDLKARWHEKVAGLAKAHEVAVLDSGLKFQPISIPPDQAQFLESRKFQVAEIARVFGCPPEMIAGGTDDSLTYANVEGRALSFLTFGLRPWLVRLEVGISQLLPRGQFARFNPGALLKATAKESYEALEIGIRSGLLTPNEARNKLDLAPLPGGDQLAVPAPAPAQEAA